MKIRKSENPAIKRASIKQIKERMRKEITKLESDFDIIEENYIKAKEELRLRRAILDEIDGVSFHLGERKEG